MSSNLFESIAFDSEYSEDCGFYIAVKNLNNREVQRKPLSAWLLTKELTTSIIVRIEKSNFGNLEQPTVSELYKVDLTYSVNPSAKSLFLKKEVQQSPNNESIICRLFLKDVNNGYTQSLPLPNENYHDEHDITISKSVGKLISIKDSVKLLKSSECLGIFDSSLTKKFLI
jgi:hypothetical protein